MDTTKLLLRLLRPQRKRITLLLVVIAGATFISVGALPALVYALFHLLDQHSQPLALAGRFSTIPWLVSLTGGLNAFLQGDQRSRMHALIIVAAAMLVASLLRSLLAFSRAYLGQFIGGRVLIDLRTRLFERLQRLSLAFYESQRVGDLMSRLTTDVALVQQLVTEDMTNYVAAPLIVAGGLTGMCILNWRLTLFMLIFAPFTAWVIVRMGGRMRRLTRSQQERIGDLNARLHERLASIRVIQSFTREQYEVERFRELNESTFEAFIRVARVGALAPQVVQFLASASFVLVTAYAGVLIIRGQMNVASLMAYVTITQQVGVYFVKFGTLHLRVQQSLAALRRVTEIVEQEREVRESPQAIPLPPVEGRISLHHVSFQYREGETVLEDINLDIAPGRVIALVGPSGAGKTSLTNLVMRFYDPTEGRITIDGHDLRQVTLQSLRSQIGLVPQETILFGGTVKENIRYGRAAASEEEVIAAADAANAHQFITALPDGYNSEVGERGAKLSGGQRQRIAVARALLKDPRILILDEATSSLDAESEALVQEALERLMKGRTTLVIAHRLSTIRNADSIAVLSDGKLVEYGSHDQLLAAGGLYTKLYGAQQSGGLPPEPPGRGVEV